MIKDCDWINRQDMTTSRMPVRVNTKEHAEQIINDYDNFLFDCDGVIWLDEKLIPQVAETIELLKSKNKRFAFVTNNSSKSRDTYVEKFKRLGIEGIEKNAIYPTCYAAAINLKGTLGLPEGSKVWVLGDDGIETELKELGYVPLGGNDARLNEAFSAHHELLKVDPDVRAVVIGSTKDINYLRISSTLQYLLYNGKSIPFVGCNIDRTYPGPDGLILPAGGSVVQNLAYTAHRDYLPVGKPSRVFLDTILDDMGFDRSKTLMVGDTLYTDIKFGNDGVLGGSLLVLSGGTSDHDLHDLLEHPDKHEGGESLIPSHYIESLGHLIELLS